MSRRGTRRRRRRAGGAGGDGSSKVRLPFPYSILANIKLFYLGGIVVMVVGLLGGVLVIFGGGSPQSAQRQTSQTNQRGDASDDGRAAVPGPDGETAPYKREPPLMVIDPSAKRYLAAIETEKGIIRLELFAQEAPATVNNFVALARDGYYNGLTFHYVLNGFVAMAGDPSCRADGGGCTGRDGPGYALPRESSSAKHLPGAIAMVSEGGESHGSMFYITYDDLSQRLDGRGVVFGRVIDGMNVLRSLAQTNPRQPTAPPGDRIIGVTIAE